MPNKLQRAAERRRKKYVPSEGSDLWLSEHGKLPVPTAVDMSHLQKLRSYIDLEFMGMKALTRHVADIEEYLCGDSVVPVMEDINIRLRNLESELKDLKQRLDDALREV